MKKIKWLGIAGSLLLTGLSFSACNMSGASGVESKNWTVLVYMCADNNLAASALCDINEMEAANFDEDKVNVLVLADIQNEGTKLYDIKNDKNGMNEKIISETVSSRFLGLKKGTRTNLNVAKEKTLEDFLRFGKKYYPAEKTALVVWGHGSGWRNQMKPGEYQESRAVAFDDASQQFMPVPSLASAIQSQLKNQKLDLIGFDTCFGLEFEVLYELKECAWWFAGVEGFEEVDGWDYTKWLSSFSFDAAEDGKQFGLELEKQFVEENDTNFGVFDLSKMQSVFEAFDDFCCEASTVIKDEESRLRILDALRSKVINFYVSGTDSDLVVDVLSFSKLLVSENPALSNQSAILLDEIRKAVATERAYVVDRYPLGIFMCAVNPENELQKEFSELYINGAKVEGQSKFVQESQWYVPSVERRGSVLDRLFCMTYFTEEEK